MRDRPRSSSSSMHAVAAVLIAVCCHCSHEPPVVGPRPSASRARGRIVEAEPGRFRYDYYDVSEPDSHVGRLQAMGLHGGGPTWEGIIYGLLELRNPAALTKIEFDPEGDGIAVWSAQRPTLDLVASLVAEAKADPTLLAKAIDLARRDGRIE